jgi:hypothetical protein
VAHFFGQPMHSNPVISIIDAALSENIEQLTSGAFLWSAHAFKPCYIHNNVKKLSGGAWLGLSSKQTLLYP